MSIGIGFDIDHTLVIDNKLERIALLRLLEDIRADGGYSNGTLGKEERDIDALLDANRHVGRSIEEAVATFVQLHGITNHDAVGGYVARFKHIALELVQEVVIPLPGARQTMAELQRRGVALACLTNGWNPLQQMKALRAGFDGAMIVSSETGVQKPDPRAFAALAQALGTSQLWYVGDNPKTDVAGALAAGFHAVWLDAEGTSYPTGLPAPTRTIRCLTELLEINCE